MDTKNVDKEVIEHDITDLAIISIVDQAVNGREVDIIIGGPPCQAYSSTGYAAAGVCPDSRFRV